MVKDENKETILNYIKSRGMACGVYSANYLLEALFNENCSDFGAYLMSNTSDRSWYNMLRAGSTITTEAWDNRYKNNNGWTHCWSASPAHIIARKVLGVEPLEAGFSKISIKPHMAFLSHAKGKVPTIKGEVMVSFKRNIDRLYMNVEIPSNTVADIYVPNIFENSKLFLNGEQVSYEDSNGWLLIKNVSSKTNKIKLVPTEKKGVVNE